MKLWFRYNFFNRTRAGSREEKKLSTFFEANRERWVETAYEAEGVFYMGVLALAVYSPVQWTTIRVSYLQRLLVAAHTRAVSPHPPPNNKVTDKSLKDWAIYKHAAIFWALVDGIYTMFFKVCWILFSLTYPNDVDKLQCGHIL